MFPISLSGTNAKRLRLGAPRRAASLHLASNLAPGCVSLLGISTTDVPRHVGRTRFASPGSPGVDASRAPGRTHGRKIADSTPCCRARSLRVRVLTGIEREYPASKLSASYHYFVPTPR